MKIEVLGSGCAKCKRLEKNVKEAVKNTGVKAEIVKVEDISKIMARGVMMTPALAIDGKVVSTGKVLSKEDVAKFIK